MINLSIDLTRIQEDKLTITDKGAKWLNIVLLPLQAPDQYGNTHYAVYQQTKDERLAGVQRTYVKGCTCKEWQPKKDPA